MSTTPKSWPREWNDVTGKRYRQLIPHGEVVVIDEPDQTNYAGGTERDWNAVSNPRHYHRGGMECVDVIDACVIGLTPQEAFRLGNALKYLWRWKEKNGVEDLKKARQCINMLIKIVSGENA